MLLLPDVGPAYKIPTYVIKYDGLESEVVNWLSIANAGLRPWDNQK